MKWGNTKSRNILQRITKQNRGHKNLKHSGKKNWTNLGDTRTRNNNNWNKLGKLEHRTHTRKQGFGEFWDRNWPYCGEKICNNVEETRKTASSETLGANPGNKKWTSSGNKDWTYSGKSKHSVETRTWQTLRPGNIWMPKFVSGCSGKN